MPRSIWKGHVTFGLVSVPVSLYSAEERKDISLKLIDGENHARVRYSRVNEATGEEVPWGRIVKGYEYGDGNYVLLGDEELKNAAVEMTKAVEIEEFVELDAVDVMYFDKPYYLAPNKHGEKPYALLREALRQTKKVGIGKVVIRTRQHLAAVVPKGEVLVLELLRFQDELRGTEELDLPGEDLEALKIAKKEVDMAVKLVDGMSAEWDPSQYHDEYREALMGMIEQKIETGEFQPAPEEAAETPEAATVNLMDLLKKSVDETRKTGTKRKKPAGKRAG